MGCFPIIILFVLGAGIGYATAGSTGAVWGAGTGLVLGALAGLVLVRLMKGGGDPR